MQPKKIQYVSRLRVYTLMLLGMGLVIASSLMPGFWIPHYHNMIANVLKMTPKSKTYEMWSTNPVPVYIEFFFFNWTNQHLLESEGENHIPEFNEMGPYRFSEELERVNVTWNGNSTVTYQQRRWWKFQPEHSKGSLKDNITTLNTIALTAANTVKDWSTFFKVTTSGAFLTTQQRVHITRTVGELLFDGYSDKLITIAQSMPSLSGMNIPFDKFAWFYMRNGTTFMDGVFNMNTGEEDIQKIGKLENWNYGTRTNYFSGKCAQVLGTTGQLFPPGLSKDDKLEMFSPDLCRSLAFDFLEETKVEGISGYRYHGGLPVLDNGTLFPETECFCNGECVPSGVMNLTTCRYGAPAFASFPHFYLADPYFTEFVKGMHPEKEKHQFYITLEPTTGIPLDVAARFQINLLLQPYSGIGLYRDVPTVFFPMMWFQERATMTFSIALSLRLLLLLQYLGVVMSVVVALAGCFLFGYAAFLRASSAGLSNQLTREKAEPNLYIPTSDSRQNEKNTQYIVMKPYDETAKL